MIEQDALPPRVGQPRRHRAAWSMISALFLGTALGQEDGALAGRVAMTDPASPPPWTAVHAATKRHFDLGHMLFNAQWQPAGHPTSQLAGLGPLFVESSCSACHAGGARGEPSAAAGALSSSFVLQLGGPATAYGHVLNTRAIAGHAPEGRITVTWLPREGRHADGQRWTLREPRYGVIEASHGTLPADAVLKPRIGPQVFGVGLLDAVPASALEAIRIAQPPGLRGDIGGRFGWQGDAASLVDQTAIAFAREMGLTSHLISTDDCTQAQHDCREARQADSPELPEDFFHAVKTFQFLLAAPARASIDAPADAAGAALFERVGCAACHVPRLPVPRDSGAIRIDPYTDLLLHDLGEGLADRTVAGKPVPSRWRTAPLWGLAHALQAGPVGLMHDGRASSIEEAILWHEGQGQAARDHFMALDAATRQQLLNWIGTL
jgi:CxxC motif-containing protein (DUF1111 family)